MRKVVNLKNWTLCGNVLIGEAHGHPHHKDGTVVRTSQVKFIYWTSSGPRARTRNTIYNLRGRNPEPEYPSYVGDQVHVEGVQCPAF